MALNELGDRLKVGDDVLEALGVDRSQLAEMGLRSLFELATSRGFDVGVDMQKTIEGGGRLFVEMTPPRRSPTTRIQSKRMRDDDQ